MAAKKKTPIQRKAKKAPARKPMASKERAPLKKAKTRMGAKKASNSGLGFPSTPITQKQSKAQIFNELALLTSLSKNEVKKVIVALRNLLERNLKGKGFGEFIIPELGIKVRRIHKLATKSRKGRNPFTGEEIQIPAKPARKSVKATALKKLKEIVTG